MTESRESLKSAKRVVVKVGSALLATENGAAFATLSAQIAALWDRGMEVIVVSSGAIALGLAPLGLLQRPKDLASLQAAAAAGQGRLMWRWAQAFEGHGRAVAQLLLTHADVQDRRRYLNGRHAILRLLEAGIIPIVNENDTVAVDEIKFGDNDTLAADVCGLGSASVVVLLTTADGLFTADPRTDANATRIPIVERLDDTIRAMAGPAALHGTGGMVTKLEAAKRAAFHGASTVIAPGARPDVLLSVFDGEDVGTWFTASGETPLRARKRWIATALRPMGMVHVDEGAARALRDRASLLCAGIREVSGEFDPGDAVDIAVAGVPFARGLVGMGSHDLRRVLGLRSAEVRARLGTPVADAFVHRDDLVFLDTGANIA